MSRSDARATTISPTTNSFDTRDRLQVGGRSLEIYRLDRIPGADRLPFSIKVLLENVLRREDGTSVLAQHVEAVRDWNPAADVGADISFSPSRVLLQDFTGVPCVVDLVAMRDGMAALGGDADRINPLIPGELVIDHSVIAEAFGGPNALRINADLENERNRERYQLLRWAQAAFNRFVVVPPDTGICHQVNLEYLARVVDVTTQAGERGRDVQVAHPDTLVGTDSHTPMVNGLGVLGWGVGGIEAEAAMLGQPISMLVPRVLGVKLSGDLTEGVTATDLVLTVAELLRQTGVVGSFVEFYGPGVGAVPLADRATLGNMSPEYGSTCSIFPIDQVTLDYLHLTGRDPAHVDLVEAYAKTQGLWHDPDHEPTFSKTLELDLASVVPSIAGPRRPQDRIALAAAKRTVLDELRLPDDDTPLSGLDEAASESFPASDPIGYDGSGRLRRQRGAAASTGAASETGAAFEPGAVPTLLQASGTSAGSTDQPGDLRPSKQPRSVPVTFADGSTAPLSSGDVVIAAITSCTNTSNPSVMVAAGLVAKKAVELGLTRKPWVKTSLAPGSRVVTDYLHRAGLASSLEQLGFHLVGYGCTTCIGNSGPLIAEVEAAVTGNDLTVCSVLSGNRNFEGRIHPLTAMSFLASPPLVVAYALAGTMRLDLTTEPLGRTPGGDPVYLRDLWPSTSEISQVVGECLQASMFAEGYADVFTGDHNWQSLPVPDGTRFTWSDDSTYIRRPPYFVDLPHDAQPLGDIDRARVLVKLGDSVTTDHISPAGAIGRKTPAGQYLHDHGVEPGDFNSYGSRRGNHEVMVRGTFANIRLRNELVPGTTGGYTRVHDDDRVRDAAADRGITIGETATIFDASEVYQRSGVPLVVLAGREYGSGSSRDWAAKGTLLLGVRAVLAQSFERIHRSNLIGMGVLPLEFLPGDSASSFGLTGDEMLSVRGLNGRTEVPERVTVVVETGTKEPPREFEALVRISTPSERAYYRHGGILPYVLRQLLDA